MKVTLMILGTLFSLSVMAQKEVNTSWSDYINPIFAGLDKTKVPHGVLLDYAMEFTNVPSYNGTLTDSTNIDIDVFGNIYKTLYMGKVTTDTVYFPKLHTVAYYWASERLSNNTETKKTLIIAGLLYKYSNISSDALLQNQITVSSNKYFDKYIGGVWQNPYETKTAIAFSLPVTTYNKRDIIFKLPQNLLLSNMSGEIQQIEFDPNDGNGYRTLAVDQDVNVSYTANGIYDVVFKITLSGNQALYSRTKIKIEQTYTSVKWEDRNK